MEYMLITLATGKGVVNAYIRLKSILKLVHYLYTNYRDEKPEKLNPKVLLNLLLNIYNYRYVYVHMCMWMCVCIETLRP